MSSSTNIHIPRPSNAAPLNWNNKNNAVRTLYGYPCQHRSFGWSAESFISSLYLTLLMCYCASHTKTFSRQKYHRQNWRSRKRYPEDDVEDYEEDFSTLRTTPDRHSDWTGTDCNRKRRCSSFSSQTNRAQKRGQTAKSIYRKLQFSRFSFFFFFSHQLKSAFLQFLHQMRGTNFLQEHVRSFLCKNMYVFFSAKTRLLSSPVTTMFHSSPLDMRDRDQKISSQLHLFRWYWQKSSQATPNTLWPNIAIIYHLITVMCRDHANGCSTAPSSPTQLTLMRSQNTYTRSHYWCDHVVCMGSQLPKLLLLCQAKNQTGPLMSFEVALPCSEGGLQVPITMMVTWLMCERLCQMRASRPDKGTFLVEFPSR